MTEKPKVDKAKEELKANAEKALDMKRKAGAQTTTPEHRTSHQGGVGDTGMSSTDEEIGKEGTYESNLRRSHAARVGDTGRTTGPGRRK